MTPSQRERTRQFFDDLQGLLSRVGGVGLGVSTFGSEALGYLNQMSKDVCKARACWDEHDKNDAKKDKSLRILMPIEEGSALIRAGDKTGPVIGFINNIQYPCPDTWFIDNDA